MDIASGVTDPWYTESSCTSYKGGTGMHMRGPRDTHTHTRLDRLSPGTLVSLANMLPFNGSRLRPNPSDADIDELVFARRQLRALFVGRLCRPLTDALKMMIWRFLPSPRQDAPAV